MRDGTGGSRYSKLAAGLAFGAALWATPAFADPPPAGAPPAVPPDATPPPPPAAPPPAAPPPAVKTEVKPPTDTEAMAASRPEVLPPIDVGAWTRIGSVFQGASDKKKLNDWHMDSAYVELHAGGKIHKKVGVTLNLNANMTNFGAPTTIGNGDLVAVEDAIISFDFQDEIHLWAGHLLVPVDRANASGPFFMIPWNYPGFFTASAGAVAAPHEGPSGRNNGAVVWGDISGGKLTYLAGVFDDANAAASPLFSGRVRLALWDQEPGFWGNASYFGDKDLLSIGVGGQFQKHGSTSMAGDKDYAEVNADALIEKKLGAGAFVTGEGSYYHYNVPDGGVSDAFYLLAAYATPTIGVGNIQPMVRYQWEKLKNVGGSKPWNLDVGVSYLIKGPALRLLATYSHTDFGALEAPATATSGGVPDSTNSVQLGAQAIFF
jgi:hypothetical protein